MRNHTTKSYVALSLVAVGLVVLAGCSADSPTAPKSPTPTPRAAGISLAAAPTQFGAGQQVQLTATLSGGTQPVPDGTSVTFRVADQTAGVTCSSGIPVVVFENGLVEITKTTTAGVASTFLVAPACAATDYPNGFIFEVAAVVPNFSDDVTLVFLGAADATPTPTGTPEPTDFTPEIYTISPTSGPISGGTRVTISGKGFQDAVQVMFGEHEAQVVSVGYNAVIVTSPSITPSEPDTPTTVPVSVRNLGNGLLATSPVPFRYGEALFISSISPNEGPADVETLVTIFGQGFEAPVRVMVGDVQATPISVAGTQIVARFPALPESARSCGDVGRTVEVTNINSNLGATGPDFFYRAERALLTSVTLDSGLSNIILEYVPVGPVTCTTPWGSHTLTLNGSGFQLIGANSAMWASFQGTAGEFLTTYVSSNRLTMPAPDLSAIDIQTAPCVPAAGGTGVRNIDTPVGVTVRNQRNGCTDTLPAGLVIRPCDTQCQTAVQLSVIVSGTGNVNSAPPGIVNCTSICQAAFLDLTDITLVATPTGGSVFSGWSCVGSPATNCDLSTSPVCNFTLSAADGTSRCTAVFGVAPTPTP
jgi:hypothetical protein